ncbi:unnamed protein product [Ilex paraguariensis]|uniref:FAS1 domain-containing protein n=1 Tax=Ilex paraguariensis TaxID=185542 RepID=A0ABC8TN78_9AQUA
MSPSVPLLFSCFLLLSSTVTAFNITKLLGRYDGFNTFNDLLTQTHLNDEINSRRTISVLAVSDGNIAQIAGKPIDVIKNILSNHVVLDYYDILKLNNLSKGSALLTTLFQTTGVASQKQGFLNVTNSNGEIVFSSAVKGSPHDVKLVKSVAAQPYNISVLEISAPIIAPGLDAAPYGPTAAPKKPQAPAPAPHSKKSPPPPPVESPTEAEAPTITETEAPTPSADAEAPADAPVSSPPAADAPTADSTTEAPAPGTSSAGKGFVSNFCMALLVGLVASFFVAM